MKIGVVTFWHGNENYGMMLQCWALQKFLQKNGQEPFVVRFESEPYKSSLRKRIEFFSGYALLRILYRKLLYICNYSTNILEQRQKRLRNFEGFRRSHINWSKRKYSSLKELQKHPPEADCYIVGSDQVWSLILENRNNRGFFLDFGAISIRRVAYAPSFGRMNYPEHLKAELKDCLSRFDALSVREYAGLDICHSVGYDAVKVLDPTLLLDKDDYLSLINSSKITNEDYIFIYYLNISSNSDIRWDELQQEMQMLGNRVVVTPGKGYLKSAELFDDEIVTYSYASVGEWLDYINHAKCVVTTSFHGVVLSIILQKKFIYVPLKGTFSHTNNRVFDLLSDLHLQDRILTDNSSYRELLHCDVAWDSAMELLDGYKRKSIEYLEKSVFGK